ncbi:MAG: aldehyde-activating protein [Caulobacteraceae bacterium]|nr:aldehyde-activating protein [Caulobacteraceae bacterium]
MSEPLTGGCLCGEIRYSVDSAVERLVACYCKDCQRMTSAGGSVNAVVPASAFRLTKGQTKVFTKAADSGNALHRHFCGDCGSWIYNPMGGDPEYLVLKAGTFDRHEGMQIKLNLWTGSRAPWAPMDTTLTAREKQ